MVRPRGPRTSDQSVESGKRQAIEFVAPAPVARPHPGGPAAEHQQPQVQFEENIPPPSYVSTANNSLIDPCEGDFQGVEGEPALASAVDQIFLRIQSLEDTLGFVQQNFATNPVLQQGGLEYIQRVLTDFETHFQQKSEDLTRGAEARLDQKFGGLVSSAQSDLRGVCSQSQQALEEAKAEFLGTARGVEAQLTTHLIEEISLRAKAMEENFIELFSRKFEELRRPLGDAVMVEGAQVDLTPLAAQVQELQEQMAAMGVFKEAMRKACNILGGHVKNLHVKADAAISSMQKLAPNLQAV